MRVIREFGPFPGLERQYGVCDALGPGCQTYVAACGRMNEGYLCSVETETYVRIVRGTDRVGAVEKVADDRASKTEMVG